MSAAIPLQKIGEVRERLLQHGVYQNMTSPEHVRILMKHHVFAVWDFMSLLKKLQQELTCVTLPWVPTANANFARFINEIVIGEETDENGTDGYASHFELYIEAMKEVGADAKPIQQYLALLAEDHEPVQALEQAYIPDSVREFVTYSLQLAFHGKPHEVAAAFFYGREDLIPDMFTVLIKELEKNGNSYDRLVYYLNRHIELDGDKHGPLAEKLLLSLCGEDEQKRKEAEEVACKSLEYRIRLWDGVQQEIEEYQLS